MSQVGLSHVDQYLTVSSADLPPGCSAVVYSNGSTLVYWNQQADSPAPCGGKQAVTVGTVANSPTDISAIIQCNSSVLVAKKIANQSSWSSQISCPRRKKGVIHYKSKGRV
jgi:hypothetical protein